MWATFLSNLPSAVTAALEAGVGVLSESSIVLVPIFFTVLIHYSVKVFNELRKAAKPMPGPVGLPFVGYLPFLTSEPHRKLAELAKKYGPIFNITLGTQDFIILSGHEIIKEAFVKQGAVFSGRPVQNVFTTKGKEEVLAADDGPIWKIHRQFAHNTLKGFGMGKSSLEPVIKEEIEKLLNELSKDVTSVKRSGELIRLSIANNICLLVFGRRFDYDSAEFQRLNQLIDERIQLYSNLSTRLCFPLLARVWNFLGFNRKLAALQDELLTIIHKLLASDDFELNSNGDNYANAYKKEQGLRHNESPQDQTFSDERLEGNVAVLLGAGSDSVGLTMLWTAKYLAAYPAVQTLVHQELNQVVGPDRLPCYEDRQMLPYCSATMLEVLRITSVLPLGVAHSNTEDSLVLRNFIPERCYVIANLWALHNDPDVWKKPQEFRPERHLNEHNVVINSPHLMPFSVGPRVCLGESMARMEYFLYFTMLLRKFELRGPKDGCINFQAESGFSLRPTSFEIEFHPRVDSN